jgi:DNA-binding response OmpR family regulator
MARKRILVVDRDLDSLTRIYLALIHRNYKTEASDKPEEMEERIKRLKPMLMIVGPDEYELIKDELKTPAIIVVANDFSETIHLNDGDKVLRKPIHVDQLMQLIDELLY